MNLITLGAILASCLVQVCKSDTIQLAASNIDEVLNRHELVLVNFYADWCRFSQMLAPVFTETAKQVKNEFPEEGKVAFGKVDCDRETSISSKFHVSKYPTLKVFRNGNLIKREYRGQRTPEAMGNFLREQLKSPIEILQSAEDVDNLDSKKRHVVFYVDSEASPDYPMFSRVASVLRDDCKFHVVQGEASSEDRLLGNKVTFKYGGVDSPEEGYNGNIQDYDQLHAWTRSKCIPLVREITFENAEELTEEGLPFLILFHNPNDKETPEKFRKAVAVQLMGEQNGVNFLTADGLKFSHPLYHLGKTASDLPILAIDSFRHMYLWKHDPKVDFEQGNLLKEFIADLHSGKLHREFHHGPDATTKPPTAIGHADSKEVPHEANGKHFDVQQQVIVRGGMAIMRVIKIGPHIGPHEPGHISKTISDIEKKMSMESEKLVAQAVKASEDGVKVEGGHLEVKVNEGKDEVKKGEEQEKNDDYDEDDDDEDKEDDNKGDPSFDNDLPKINEVTINIAKDGAQKEEPVGATSTKIFQYKTKVAIHSEKAERETTGKPSPPESVFKHLGPSRNRYTVLRDEL